MPALEHFTVHLDPSDAEAGGARCVDRALPQPKLFVAQFIPGAGLCPANHAFADPADDIGLATGDPALSIRRGHPIDG